MATSKSDSKTKTKEKKATVKTKVADTAKKPAARKKTVAKSVPGEDEIRQKAQEIYNDRISRGEAGNAQQDWLKAEELLKG